MPFAESCALAPPCASVPTTTALDPLAANTALAPLPGAENVTELPTTPVVTGQPFEFASVIWSGCANEGRSRAVWGGPPASSIVFGGFESGHACVDAAARCAPGTAAHSRT